MTAVSVLYCESCSNRLTWAPHVSQTAMRQAAKTKGWRRDKLGRDICPEHEKLKGARK